MRVNVGTGGGWGPTDQVLDDEVTHDQRGLVGLARHPQGAVAVWTRRSTSTNYNDDILVSRLTGTWDTPKVFDAPNRYTTPSVATNATGRSSSPPGSTTARDRRGRRHPRRGRAIAHRRVGRHDAGSRPKGTNANIYRDAHAGGGGSAFYVGWGVHGTGNSRTEIVSTKPPGRARTRRRRRRPPPTPSPTPAPTAIPLPVPPATPTPTPILARRRTPQPPAPKAADFTTLPAASKCVKRPQAHAPLQAPAQGLHGQDRHREGQHEEAGARSRGPSSSGRYYLRKLPRGTFTVTVSITLTKGKGLTERRRYTSCTCGILGRVHPLVVEDLRKHYGRTAAVDGLSFAVPAGSVCGFLGPNGAGKTTTLRILLGLTAATEGARHATGRVAGVLDRDGFHPGPDGARRTGARRRPRRPRRPRRGARARRADRDRRSPGRRVLVRHAPPAGGRRGAAEGAGRPAARRARRPGSTRTRCAPCGPSCASSRPPAGRSCCPATCWTRSRRPATA